MSYLDETGVENDENEQRAEKHEQAIEQILVDDSSAATV